MNSLLCSRFKSKLLNDLCRDDVYDNVFPLFMIIFIHHKIIVDILNTLYTVPRNLKLASYSLGK